MRHGVFGILVLAVLLAAPSAFAVCVGGLDPDGDGICSADDNCPSNCNVQQLDADNDGMGDVCDSDDGCGGGGWGWSEPDCEATCTPSCPDADGDLYCGDTDDCNDNDAQISPGEAEVCADQVDNNCDGQVDEGCIVTCTDDDGDGYSVEGYTCGEVDCDDTNDQINPGALEACDYPADNNCDGQVNEGCYCPDPDGDGLCGAADNCPNNCNAQQLDADNDGVGDVCDSDDGCGGGGWGTSEPNCEVACTPSCVDADGDSYSAAGGACGTVDCDDANALRNPDMTEVCGDGIDNNCDGSDLACAAVCTPAASQACACADGSASTQTCKTDGSGWNACGCTVYTIVEDGALSWQDPQREAYNSNDVGINPKEAIKYCGDLVLGGYDDWRLPTMNELRSLIDGNPDTEVGGACPVDDDATKMDGWYMTCIGGDMWAGPGDNGCYLKAGFTGTCDKIDIYSADHHLETWAVTEASDDPRWIASVLFEIGGAAFNHICSLGDVRCVRDAGGTPVTCTEAASCEPGAARACTSATGNPGAQECNAAGDCWGSCESNGWVDDPTITPECDNDMCSVADNLQLTININGTLTEPPHQLIAFFYDSTTWQWPPIGPPDGGTWTNQIVDPGMPPYTMNVPGCTYYGEYLLDGDYQLMSMLQQDAKFPPIPVCGDYIYGEGQAPITHPLGGDTPMTITLEPMCPDPCPGQELCPTSGLCVDDSSDEAQCCPADRAVRCGVGTALEGQCVTTPADCDPVLTCIPPGGTVDACTPCPDDSAVWGCRFSTSFAADSCADFAVKDGFVTEQDAIDGANGGGSANSTPVCTYGYSCRYERALVSNITRCTFTDNGDPLYAYGVPSIGCTFGGGSDFRSSGPICDEY